MSGLRYDPRFGFYFQCDCGDDVVAKRMADSQADDGIDADLLAAEHERDERLANELREVDPALPEYRALPGRQLGRSRQTTARDL